MAARINRERGPIDILVNNAGVLVKGDLADLATAEMGAMRRTNVDGLTRRFAMEPGLHGITVNAVAPRLHSDRHGNRRQRPQCSVQATLDAMAAKALVRRTGLPEDIANAVAFLVSPESGFITSRTLTATVAINYIAHRETP